MSYTDADVTRTMLSHVGWVSDFLDGKRTARPIPDAITDGELMVMLQKWKADIEGKCPGISEEQFWRCHDLLSSDRDTCAQANDKKFGLPEIRGGSWSRWAATASAFFADY